MIKLKVGKNFPLIKMPNGIMFDLVDSGFHLLVGMRDIVDEEIISFRKNKIEMDLVYVNDIIFLILSIDNVIHILDAPL